MNVDWLNQNNVFKDKTNLPVDQKHLNTSTQRPTPPMNSLKIMALLY